MHLDTPIAKTYSDPKPITKKNMQQITLQNQSSRVLS